MHAFFTFDTFLKLCLQNFGQGCSGVFKVHSSGAIGREAFREDFLSPQFPGSLFLRLNDFYIPRHFLIGRCLGNHRTINGLPFSSSSPFSKSAVDVKTAILPPNNQLIRQTFMA